MNPQKFQDLADHYIAAFEMTNNKQHIEYYKWQMAKSFRPAMDEALAASDEELPRKLYAVKKLTRNVIDSFVQPFHGLSEFAKKEPATVRGMFRDLFAVAEADVETKEAEIFRFMDRSHELRDKYFPDSHLYSDDLHSVTAYLFLYDPDHNYMYKAEHCRIFADCMEFYDDWGSGKDTKLEIFFRMCDECLEEIKKNQALLATAATRYEIDPTGMHPDTEKHILLFDMIYCCSTYNLFDGIHFVVPKSRERQLMMERKSKALELKQDLDEAAAKAAELDQVMKCISEAVTAGKTVRHKTFGKGRIAAVEAGRFTIDFDSAGAKDLGINLSLVNGLLAVDGLELSEEQMILLRDESRIRNAVSYAEKAFMPYVEYLD